MLCARERLLDPELHLLPEKDIKKIIKSIEKVAAKLKADAEGVENLPSGDENSMSSCLGLTLPGNQGSVADWFSFQPTSND